MEENKYIVYDINKSKEVVRISDIELRYILLLRDTDDDKKIFEKIFGLKDKF